MLIKKSISSTSTSTSTIIFHSERTNTEYKDEDTCNQTFSSSKSSNCFLSQSIKNDKNPLKIHSKSLGTFHIEFELIF